MQLRKRHPYLFADAVTVQTKFQPGDIVHSLDTGTVGTVEYMRRDGFVCIQWRGTGSREWLYQDALCHVTLNLS